jgi:hypothetical protein
MLISQKGSYWSEQARRAAILCFEGGEKRGFIWIFYRKVEKSHAYSAFPLLTGLNPPPPGAAPSLW